MIVTHSYMQQAGDGKRRLLFIGKSDSVINIVTFSGIAIIVAMRYNTIINDKEVAQNE